MITKTKKNKKAWLIDDIKKARGKRVRASARNNQQIQKDKKINEITVDREDGRKKRSKARRKQWISKEVKQSFRGAYDPKYIAKDNKPRKKLPKLYELSKQTIKSFAGKKAKKWIHADDRGQKSTADRHKRGIELAIKKYPKASNRSALTALKQAVRSLMAGKSKRKDRRIDGANFKQFLTQAA
jgi:hypothetical protein